MTTSQAIAQIRFRLGQISGLKTRIELDEKDIQMLVEMAITDLVDRIDTPSLLILPFREIINLKPYKIASIDFVMRTETPYGVTDGVSLDPFFLSNSVLVGNNTMGASLTSVLQTQAQFAIRSMAQNTVMVELQKFHDLHNQTLTVSYSGSRPNAISIFYRPMIECMEDLPSSLWVGYAIRLAVAHGKIIIGRIRSKYQVAGSPVTLGAEILSEGTTELAALYEEFKNLSGQGVVQ